MMAIEVVGIALMLAVSVTAIVAIVVEARFECRMLRVQRELMERMTNDTRD